MVINELLSLTIRSLVDGKKCEKNDSEELYTYLHSMIFKVFFCLFKMGLNHFM